MKRKKKAETRVYRPASFARMGAIQVYANRKEPKSSGEQNQSDYALMARHTKQLTCATWALVAVAAVAAVIAYFQFCALQRSDETSRLRDRAYLYFGDPTLLDDPGPQTGTSIRLRNFGNMPAQQVMVSAACVSLDQKSGSIKEPYDYIEEWSEINAPQTLAPKQPAKLLGCPILDSDIDKIPREASSFFIIMEACYLDGFESNIRRVTQMSRVLNMDSAGGRSWGFAGQHNCADDKCPLRHCE